MDKEIGKKWVDALRSGEYKQGKRFLNKNGFCCLGVLCDLYSKETSTPWQFNYIHFCDRSLPIEIMEWAKINPENGSEVLVPTLRLNGETSPALSTLNDRGMSFEEISKIIEDYMREL